MEDSTIQCQFFTQITVLVDRQPSMLTLFFRSARLRWGRPKNQGTCKLARVLECDQTGATLHALSLQRYVQAPLRMAECRVVEPDELVAGIIGFSTAVVLVVVLGLCALCSCSSSTARGDGRTVAAFMPTPQLASGLREISVTLSKSIPSVVAGCFPITFGLGREPHDLNGRRGDARGIMARSGSSRIPLGASTVSYGRRNDDNDDAFHFPEGQTNFVAECDLPTARGNFRMRAYSYRGAKVVMRDGEKVLEWQEMEPVVIYKENLRGSTEAVVRVHDQCYTSEVLGSMRCDCREQLELALDYIEQHGGLVVYMPQEGRGIGLANKIAAYQLQDGGLDTVDANRALGFGDDERSYACVPYMLKDMGIERIRLMTNNPFKIRQVHELSFFPCLLDCALAY